MIIKVTETNVYIVDVIDHIGEDLNEDGNEEQAIEKAREWYDNGALLSEHETIWNNPDLFPDGVRTADVSTKEGGVDYEVFEPLD